MTRLTCFLLLFSLSVATLQAEFVHVVKKNETLFGISRKYHLSVSELIAYNDIDDPSHIPIGMELKIPDMYEVRRGDTLYGLARRFGITLQELREQNDLDDTYMPKVGDILRVPHNKVQSAESSVVQNQDRTSSSSAANAAKGTLNGGWGSVTWPHEGARSSLSGKLTGVQIEGDKGDAIISVSSGEVVWVAPYRGYGKMIIIAAPDNHMYAYGGNETTSVKVGDRVFPGTELGRLGINSHEGKAVVFFLVYRNGRPLNPEIAPRR
ncbi:MAG: M23 family metallopeptidase [Spirochaetales bacterium]|nr:M23 family metallopeptidase [Spirochaetales bacterium]